MFLHFPTIKSPIICSLAVFKRELERDIQADTSGDFKRLLTSLVTGNREDRPQADVELAKKEANELYKVSFLLVLPYLVLFISISAKYPLMFRHHKGRQWGAFACQANV